MDNKKYSKTDNPIFFQNIDLRRRIKFKSQNERQSPFNLQHFHIYQ